MKKLLLFFLLLSFSIVMYATNADNNRFTSFFSVTKELLADVQHWSDTYTIESLFPKRQDQKQSGKVEMLKAACTAYNLPFKEGFNSASTSFSCWTIVDGNNDSTTPTGDNIWKQVATSTQEGDRTMQFSGKGASTKHNDWLISPALKMTGGIYAITYYYKTVAAAANEFEILLSTQGTAISQFTLEVLPKATYRNGDYIKKTVYVQNITGDVHIAWHVVSTGATLVYIDNVTIEKVGCFAPQDDVVISGVAKDQVKVEWKDDINSNWEYYVQAFGGAEPVGAGNLSSTKSTTVNRLSGQGGNLQPNTEYEVYIRSNCGQGGVSKWVGPIRFKTACVEFTTPFWEGFNKNSTTWGCWTILDGNKDATTAIGNNIWSPNFDAFEGDQAMYFAGSGATTKHDDWLISPAMVLDPTKVYRLRFHYKAALATTNEFEVVASNKGTDKANFTKVIVAATTNRNATYIEKTAFISDFSGNVNLAWHVISTGATTLRIDNVFIEEVTSCPEPLNLGISNQQQAKVNLTWTDEFKATNWEYYVQIPGVGKGQPTGSGTATTSKDIAITQDNAGLALQPNTQYEYYVRTVCGNGQFSLWSGPFRFMTACNIFKTPVWEGFNIGANTLRCWTVLDNNNDAVIGSNDNIWSGNATNYEGGQSFNFKGSGGKTHDDWAVTPAITFEANKIYRLKYHYKVEPSNSNDFEVVLSNTGIDPKKFTKTIVAVKPYKNSEWTEEYVYITGISGDVHIAWHVTAVGATNIYIDNVFVEEVFGCPEPLKLEVKDIESTQVSLKWTDDFKATSWEYYVQEKGLGMPKTKGTLTSNKVNIATIANNTGKALMPNTDYEFYVRTVCADGASSIWSGPIRFITACSIYEAPFWEGFNLDSKSIRCWTIIDGNYKAGAQNDVWQVSTSAPYEGNRAMMLNMYDFDNIIDNDDWLISPLIKLDGGNYVLKYRYKSNATANTNFEVLLSTEGPDVTKFKKTVVSSKVYLNATYMEEVVVISGVTGNVNIAWHALSKGTTVVTIDDILIRKEMGCPEPYYVTVSGQTSNTIDVSWKQDGGVTNWEVIVVDYKADPSAGNPANIIKVSGTPKTQLTGLTAGKVYTIYVRAICSDTGSKSAWSTGADSATGIGGNDSCAGPISIPVNSGLDCDKVVSGSFVGANLSVIKEPSCQSSATARTDVWFEFTAASTIHMLSLKNVLSNVDLPYLYGSIFEVDCKDMVPFGGAAAQVVKECFTLGSPSYSRIMSNLVPGRKYLIRLATTTKNPDYLFNACITSGNPVEVSPSGDKYTVEELVKDVLISSNCDLVSNIKYRAGENSTINTLGYFNKGKSDFPFDEGIVLTTHNVKYVPGPYATPTANREKVPEWTGDADLNEVIKQVGGAGFGDKKFVSVLEFDFIPIKDSIKFEYLFASESYAKNCKFVCTAGGALFAAWLTEVATGDGQNLALIPGSNEPIALSTIRNSDKSGAACKSENPEYYGKHFAENNDAPLGAAISYIGMTVPMSSEMVAVKPGKKYRIKLAIADFCDTPSHTSAVFFNAGSFDLGTLDLGADLLVETNNALCQGASQWIKSGISIADNQVIEWTKDGVVIPGETKPDLEVKESGTYKISAKYTDVNCEATGTIKVEMYPAISAVVAKPITLEVCRYSLDTQILDLTTVEEAMFKKAGRQGYEVAYFRSMEAADAEENPISNPEKFEMELPLEQRNLYIRVEYVKTGCYEVFVLPIKLSKGLIPQARENVAVCASYVFPTLETDQYYYTKAGATGVNYKAGDVLTQLGKNEIFVFQDNGKGCYEEISYQVEITEAVSAALFGDEVLECKLYELKELPRHNKYFTQSGGQGAELAVGSILSQSQTIFVYAASEDGLCTDESSFKISFKDCPIPKGISPNGDGLNDRFDLSMHGVSSIVIYNRYGAEVFAFQGAYTDQWEGQGKGGKLLPDGTYYYVVIAHGKTKTGWVQINK